MGDVVDDGNDFEAFRIPPGSTSPPDAASAPAAAAGRSPRTSRRGRERMPRQHGAFIRGPIPLTWLDIVLSLPGATPVRVALALVYQSGLEGSSTVRFTRNAIVV